MTVNDEGKTVEREQINGVREIRVDKVDNELYILASSMSGGSELCHIKVGYNRSGAYTLYPPTILAPGSYDLTFIGINWGGPTQFSVTIMADDKQSHSYGDSSNGDGKIGVVWNKTVSITVPSPQGTS